MIDGTPKMNAVVLPKQPTDCSSLNNAYFSPSHQIDIARNRSTLIFSFWVVIFPWFQSPGRTVDRILVNSVSQLRMVVFVVVVIDIVL